METIKEAEEEVKNWANKISTAISTAAIKTAIEQHSKAKDKLKELKDEKNNNIIRRSN